MSETPNNKSSWMAKQRVKDLKTKRIPWALNNEKAVLSKITRR